MCCSASCGRILSSLHIKNKAVFNDQEQDELVEVHRDQLVSRFICWLFAFFLGTRHPLLVRCLA
jgi:hypothetical protein